MANIRSVSKNINELLAVLQNHKTDIVALSETWLNPGTALAPLLAGVCSNYDVFRCDRQRGKGGGVALFVRKWYLPALIFKESVAAAYDLLCVNTIIGGDSVRLIVVYRTPSCSVAMTEQMCKAISDLLSCNSPCVIAGDFNFPDVQWKSRGKISTTCPASKTFTTMVSAHSLSQYVHTPTRGHNILDLVLSNVETLVRD